MGASGSAWIKHKKRKGLRPDALTAPPHPLFARAGQRYFSKVSGARARVPFRVTRVEGGEWCHGRTEDDERRSVRIRVTRLLAANEEGEGKYYRFIGYASRRGYPTHVRVAKRESDWTLLVCPEWHPNLLIRVGSRTLPIPARDGDWLACRADLGADVAARVQPHDFVPAEADFDVSCYRVDEVGLPSVDHKPMPTEGPGCGDVVLFASDDEVDSALASPGSIYVPGNRPQIARGARAYLHADGSVYRWRAVRAINPLPNGTRVVLEGPCHTVHVPSEASKPAAGIAVVHGRQVRQHWTWRTWDRVDESPVGSD